MTPREELEARLTALLLGELPDDEAAALRQTIAQDAELARLHDRLQQAIALVRETVAAPETESAAITDAPKLAGERREKLLASFKAARPKELRQPRWRSVNWGDVNWREYAALAAMLMALLGVGAILMLKAGNEPRAMEASRASMDSDVNQRQRLTIIGGSGRADLPASASLARSKNTPSEKEELGMINRSLDGSTFTASLFGDPQKGAEVRLPAGGLPVPGDQTFTFAVVPPPPPPPDQSPAPAGEVKPPLERNPRHFAGIALPALGDAVQPGSEGVNDGREKERAPAPSQIDQSDFFQGVNQGKFGRGDGALGGERPAGGLGGGGGAGGASRDGFRSGVASDEPASGRTADKKPASRPAESATSINAWAVKATDSGLVGKDINGPVSSTTPAPATPTPDTAARSLDARFGDLNRNGLGRLDGKSGLAGIASDEIMTLNGAQANRPILLPAKPAAPAEPGMAPIAGRMIGVEDARTRKPARDLARGNAAQKTASLEDNIELKTENNAIATVTNGTFSFAIAGNTFAPAQQDGWTGYMPQNGLAFGGVPAQQPPQSSLGAGFIGGADKANKPAKPNDIDALGVLSQKAVGFIDVDAKNGKTLGAKPDTANDGANRFYRGRINGSPATDTKDAAVESKKLAEISRSEYAGVTLAPGAHPIDAEVDQSGRESKRESGRALGEEPKPAQPTDEEAKLRKSRVDIALPKGERGEARESFQVATGPVAVNEIMYNDPSTGLPMPKQAPGVPGATETVSLLKESAAAQTVETETAEKPVSAVSRDLESLQTVRDRLQSRIWQEKADISMPKSGIVEIIDRAEAQSGKKPTLWERVRGAVSGEVERSTRIAVEKATSDNAGQDGQGSSMNFDPYWQQSQLEKIQSKEILGKVIEKLALSETGAGKESGGKQLNPEEAYRLLRKRLTVGTDPKSGLIDIRVKSDNAEEAARIANTIAETYRDTRAARWKERSGVGLQFLATELATNEKQIAEAQQELNRRKTESSSKEPDVALPKLAAGAAVPQPEVPTTDNAFSTFSLNVSDVSFKLAAASLEKGQMPDPATVRSEEFINAFDYRDPDPKGSAPIAFAWERARYPFAHDRDLVRFSVKTAASGRQPGRPLNLVLLLDNSGSMERADRVRIIQECLRVLAGQLQPQDLVSVVAFARTPRLWVDGLPGNQAGELQKRVGDLTPQGGTNLEDAMNLAYQTALRHYLANGVNRVVLLTDGAANLGDVQPESLKKKVEAHRKQGIALDCFGIGWEGFNDDLLETLSRNGDGRYGFVNTPEAATSEFAGQLAGALKVAASDVKVQVEFNPRRATAYRQIGYAKHQLKKEQFRDNTVDAAEIGAAEAGNALYVVQVNPAGEGPIGTVRVRFKVPGTSDYREHEWPVPYEGAARSLEQSSAALRLAASASAFSEWLVSSPYAGEVTPDKLLGYLNGVPETCPADPRPKKLEWMIRQARSVGGK